MDFKINFYVESYNSYQTTSDQEAVIAYYYMDDNNKVQVTEIFDVTESESHTMLSMDEIDTNKKLQFDDWDEPSWLSQHTLDGNWHFLFIRSINDIDS